MFKTHWTCPKCGGEESAYSDEVLQMRKKWHEEKYCPLRNSQATYVQQDKLTQEDREWLKKLLIKW